MGEIDVVASESALAEEKRNLGGKQRIAACRALDHHAGKSRRQRQLAQRLALRGDAAVGIDGAKTQE